MACKKYREKIILHLYGELGEKDTKKLMEHIKDCAECAEDLAYTQKVFQTLDMASTEEVPQANWERCWSAIDTRLEKKKPKQQPKSLFLFPKWAYAPAALILVFVAGLILGRMVLGPPQSPEMLAEDALHSFGLALQDHFESLKPVLVEYANYPDSGTERETITMDKSVIRSLLIQNVLLKRLVAEKNPNVGHLLEDVEIVLREIVNQEKEDPLTPSLIRELIKQRGILFKIEALKTL
jgi:hypothetical protein